jgi:hypothetical protein
MTIEQVKAMEASPVLGDREKRVADASVARDARDASLSVWQERVQFPPSEELPTAFRDDSLQEESEVR